MEVLAKKKEKVTITYTSRITLTFTNFIAVPVCKMVNCSQNILVHVGQTDRDCDFDPNSQCLNDNSWQTDIIYIKLWHIQNVVRNVISWYVINLNFCEYFSVYQPWYQVVYGFNIHHQRRGREVALPWRSHTILLRSWGECTVAVQTVDRISRMLGVQQVKANRPTCAIMWLSHRAVKVARTWSTWLTFTYTLRKTKDNLEGKLSKDTHIWQLSQTSRLRIQHI